MVEHRADIAGVSGSIPLGPTIMKKVNIIKGQLCIDNLENLNYAQKVKIYSCRDSEFVSQNRYPLVVVYPFTLEEIKLIFLLRHDP